MSDPVEAVRSKPGEYFLASEHVEEGMQFKVHGAVYEITSEPRKWGIGWSANITVIEGLRPGTTLRALLFTGKKVN